MPKPTFHGLPEEKREKIVALAIDEFAERPFAEASLSRIVARAGIAKGSIYQYFESKLDLYRWLLEEEVPRRKLAAMAGSIAEVDPTDLAGLLRAMLLSGTRFMLQNPRLAQLGSSVALPTADPALRQLYADVRARGLEGFTTILGSLRDRGALRTDVALSTIARTLSVLLTSGLRELMLGHFGVDMHDLLARPKAAATVTDAALEGLVDDIVRLVMTGVAAPVAPALERRSVKTRRG